MTAFKFQIFISIIISVQCINLLHSQNFEPGEARLIYCKPSPALKIDGELNDWPKNTNRYPITKRIWGDELEGSKDFSGYFQTSYNLLKNTLYIAFVFEDDETILKDKEPKWYDQDSYTLFLNEQYDQKGSGIAQFIFGENFSGTDSKEHHWDSKLRKYQDSKKISYGIKKEKNRTTLEIAILLNDRITSGRVIGLGHWFYDKDSTSATCIGWTPQGNKPDDGQPGRIGTLVFSDDSLHTGEVKGQVHWKDTLEPMKPEGLMLVSEENKNQWFYVSLDSNSQFKAKLPVGKYHILPGKKAFFNGETYLKAARFENPNVIVSEIDSKSYHDLTLLPAPPPDLNFKGNLIQDWNAKAPEKINTFIKTYMDYYQIEGVTFTALKNGKIIYSKQFGVSNNYTKEKINKKTLFEVASMTKPVFAFAVMRLYERGLIDLDKPLYKYLEFDAIKDNPYSKLITARLVLSHQTGLPNWSENGEIKFLFKPGTQFSYSGEAYEYLSRIVEKITDKNVNQVLNEEVVQPLHLKHFYFKENNYAFKHKTHGHFNGYPGKVDLPKTPWVAGCLVTTAKDYVKFLKAVLERKGLKPETYQTMFQCQIDVPENFKEGNWSYPECMGLGWFIEKTPYGKVFRHTGNNGDFDAVGRLYDDLNMAYVILSNGNSGFFITNAIEKILIDPKKLN